MAKRDFKQSPDAVFGDNNTPTIDPSFIETDSQIFGSIAAVDARIERVKSISIFEIIPDPAQPRRAVPSNVRRHWNGNPFMISDLFDAWLKAIVEERGEFPLDNYLLVKENNEDRSEEPGPMEASFMEVIDLALSIRREGLINPVTVVPIGQRYQLETGERRWLAYHLLYAYFDGKQSHVPDERPSWGKIPAREVKQVNVWRQATENSVRANLNAIGKARQFAILMMALYGEKGVRFDPFDPEAPCDRAYYAQIAKYEQAPYGKRDTILSAMGFKSPAELSRCRKLLSLPDEVWTAGDDYDLAQEQLLQLADMPAEKAIENVRKIKAEKAVTTLQFSRPYSERRAPLISDKVVKGGIPIISKEDRNLHRQRLNELLSLTERIDQSGIETREQVRQITRDLRRFLDDIERRVGK